MKEVFKICSERNTHNAWCLSLFTSRLVINVTSLYRSELNDFVFFYYCQEGSEEAKSSVGKQFFWKAE